MVLAFMLTIGGSLIYFNSRTRHQTDFISEFVEIILLILYLLLLVINIVWSFNKYKRKKKHIVFFPVFIGILMLSFVLIIKKDIYNEFNKPTLVKAYYDGDYNGVSIDFKKDGTYIIDDFLIGFNHYEYGYYRIERDTILLDYNETGLRQLIFKKKGADIFLTQNELSFELRIIEDDRRK